MYVAQQAGKPEAHEKGNHSLRQGLKDGLLCWPSALPIDKQVHG